MGGEIDGRDGGVILSHFFDHTNTLNYGYSILNIATNETTLMHVAVRELKNHFSEYLKYAQVGEEICMSMPLVYLDTSAWLKLYVEENGSEQIMPQSLIFACFNKQLNEAATVLGMMVLLTPHA